MAKTRQIKDMLLIAAAATAAGPPPTLSSPSSLPGMEEATFIQAAADGDLAAVQLAVETHKMDPNECTDVSVGSAS